MNCRSYSIVSPLARFRKFGYEDWAGIDADAHLDFGACRLKQFCLNCQSAAAGTQSMVLHHRWRTKSRHQPVTKTFIERAAKAIDKRYGCFDCRTKYPRSLLRIHP